MMQFPPLKTPAAAEKTEEESRVREVYRPIRSSRVLAGAVSRNGRIIFSGLGAADAQRASVGLEWTRPVLR